MAKYALTQNADLPIVKLTAKHKPNHVCGTALILTHPEAGRYTCSRCLLHGYLLKP